MSAIGNSTQLLSADVTNTNTFTMPYPAGLAQADLLGTTGGRLTVNDNDAYPQAANGAGTVAFSFGVSNITVTNNSGRTLSAGSKIIASFGRSEQNGRYVPGVAHTPAPQALTVSVGTGSTTIADVTNAFSQSVLNNNFRSLADQVNALTALVKEAGISAS